LYSRATGYSWYGPVKTQATTKTKYRIGSISKVFTAVMIFQLIEEGKLQLTTPLSKYYPTIPNAAKITIAQMLNHSSGIHSFTDSSDYVEWLTRKTTPVQLLAKMMNADFEPGAKHKYSNSNFVLLGYIIEKLDKKPYAASLEKRITGKKIGLKDTYYGGKIVAANNEAYSYKWQGDWKPDTETDMSIPGGAGALVSTPADLVKFMYSVFSGKLVRQASLNQMKKFEDGYGMNFIPYNFYDEIGFGHNGGIDGFQSQTVFYPKDSIAVAYVANGVNYSLNTMMIGVLSIIHNKPYQLPNFKTVSLTANDLLKYTGVYTSAQLPIKLTISNKENILVAQATGQSSFEMEASGIDTFRFDLAGITIKFDTLKNQLTLIQGGKNFLFNKDK